MLRSIRSIPEDDPPAVGRSHPLAEQLERFMRGELPLPEMLPIVRHMLSGCSECLKATRPLWELMEQKLERRGAHR